MKKTRISEGWYFQNISNKTGYLATGAAYEKIDLPHDYQIKEKRDPSLTFRTGYYPDKSGRYVKHLNFERGKHYILDVDGAYANAHVNLNESFKNLFNRYFTANCILQFRSVCKFIKVNSTYFYTIVGL